MKERPEEIVRKHGGQLRMSEAVEHGITRYMLYSLKAKGIIEQVSRGIYRLVELPPVSNPDLLTVSLRFPNAVICLIFALAFHDITTQIPHAVSVAVPRNSRIPSLDYPPIQTHRFSNKAYDSLMLIPFKLIELSKMRITRGSELGFLAHWAPRKSICGLTSASVMSCIRLLKSPIFRLC